LANARECRRWAEEAKSEAARETSMDMEKTLRMTCYSKVLPAS
jgi:hypothetical protein